MCRRRMPMRSTATFSKTSLPPFDDRIYPLTSARFGTACDTDRDGRFTILLSSWLGQLGGGRHAVDGFVRVADLDSSDTQPLRQSLRHDVSERHAQGGTLYAGRCRPRVHARGRVQPEVSEASPVRSTGPGGGGMARRGDRTPGRGSARILHVEHRLSRQCVPLAARMLSTRGR